MKIRVPKHLLLTMAISLLLTFAAHTPASAETVVEEAVDIPTVPVLLYHHIAWDTYQNPDIITPDKLWRDLLLIKQLGYSPIFFQDLITAVEKGKSLPAKPIIISFDDGYQSNYHLLYPMLKIFNFKANINLIIDSIDQAPHNQYLVYMDWQKAQEMHYSGLVEFGVHTYRMHGPQGVNPQADEPLAEYKKRFTTDLTKATQQFRQQLGFKPYIYCYPYGSGNAITEQILQDRGYKVTLATDDGRENSLQKIKRITVTQDTSLTDFLTPPEPVEPAEPLEGSTEQAQIENPLPAE